MPPLSPTSPRSTARSSITDKPRHCPQNSRHDSPRPYSYSAPAAPRDGQQSLESAGLRSSNVDRCMGGDSAMPSAASRRPSPSSSLDLEAVSAKDLEAVPTRRVQKVLSTTPRKHANSPHGEILNGHACSTSSATLAFGKDESTADGAGVARNRDSAQLPLEVADAWKARYVHSINSHDKEPPRAVAGLEGTTHSLGTRNSHGEYFFV